MNQMSNYPDFSQLGYQVIRELGRNREAGRITYQATALNWDQQVVIKEFRFADAGSDWSSFKAYQREIEVLQQMQHSRIPQYLNSFETPAGFCLVQEYKNAPSLAERCSFNPEEIKQIALSVLEILAYLQRRTPPIIHRDIKPENILVDQQLNAYLVDFGLARIRSGEVAMSSVAAGTPGFMPPEEQFGRPLTKASDLYSLGVTLICLLTGTRSVAIGNLIDDDYRFDFKKLVPQLSSSFVEWLTKMVEPNLKNRFDDAIVAMTALKPIDVVGSSIKSRNKAAVFGLASIGIIAGLGAMMIYPALTTPRQETLVKRLLETKECERCDLHGVNLKGANLGNANLRDANLQGANLEFANLGNANLQEAYLDNAKLGSANLGSANLEFAKLGSADLGSANLGSANLRGAFLASGHLQGANLEFANLRGVNLGSAYLRDANLGSANLKDAYLGGTNLEGVNLKGAKLDTKLRDANFKGAIMPDGTKHK